MKRLFISFSGGRTSAYMTYRLLQERQFDEVLVAFANTGQEHPDTLKFVHLCDWMFGFNTVWVEADVQAARGDGTTERIVTFDTASRDGQPFEAAIQKYGIRADEIDRMSSSAKADGIIYPLIEWGVTKADVLAWWREQPFNLDVPEHLGNCVWCWKKSKRKHLTIARDYPEMFDFPMRMEMTYADAGPGDYDRPRRFFRKSTPAISLLLESSLPFDGFVDPEMDLGGACGESCEIGADE